MAVTHTGTIQLLWQITSIIIFPKELFLGNQSGNKNFTAFTTKKYKEIMTTAKLLMIGAMYENGGNTFHRILDGHHRLNVYPFESQLGTRLVTDQYSSLFPQKYRWPVFDLSSTSTQDYNSIIDEEMKVRLRTPHVSKFRQIEINLSDDERMEMYNKMCINKPRTRANNVLAFFSSTFRSWKNFKGPADPEYYVGYSPAITVDSETILHELPTAQFVHVVRNPWSAYADTKNRPVPLSLSSYINAWILNQYHATVTKSFFPQRFHIVKIEDVMQNPEETMKNFCKEVDIPYDSVLQFPSWNGSPLNQVHPWGTIKIPTMEQNIETAHELSKSEAQEITIRTKLFRQYLNIDEAPFTE